MNTSKKIIKRSLLFVGFFILVFIGFSKKNVNNGFSNLFFHEESAENLEKPLAIDSPDIRLKYPIYNNTGNPYNSKTGLIDFKTPLNIKRTVIYNPITGKYEFRYEFDKGGKYRDPYFMTPEEYRKYQREKAIADYWRAKVEEDNITNSEGFAPKISERAKREFGDICEGKLIDINPQGSAEIKFGLLTNRTDNPAIPVEQRSLTTFDFDQQIQLNIAGSICDKLKINFNYNTEATFDFENQTKIGYEGDEDKILQGIWAGNVTFPIDNSLIQGSQSLFGLRTDLKFGKLYINTVFSQNRGERKEINIKNGAQQKEYELPVDKYEANRHYFINHYHRDNYDRAMSSLPNVASQVRIVKMEVWVTNRINDFQETRNIVAFADLGEAKVLEGTPGGITSSTSQPYNRANGLYDYLSITTPIRDLTATSSVLAAKTTAPGPFTQGVHYEKLENARLLSSSEYNYNSILGYISVNQSLNNDEVLGVAYQYSFGGKTYQVGEFSTDGIKGNNALFLKLLKGTITTPKSKTWDLMMKNIYSIGAYQVNETNFKLDVIYNNPKTGIDLNYIPQGGISKKTIIQVIGSDIINKQKQSFPDGVFDYIPLVIANGKVENGGTINPLNGRIIFSKVEPFGKHLEKQLALAGLSPAIIKTIAFPQLYDSTRIKAQQLPELNRFKITGTYESANSSEISLNAFNIPQGSVTVTAGGVKLIENQDYTVDYNIGRVKIMNDGILNSGTPIKISLESNSLFSSVQKTMIGTQVEYKFNKNFNLGATYLRLSERPMTQKVNIGSEPISNNMFGLNGNYQTDAPFLTKLTDNIPFISTKEKSSISATFEAAYLIPGHNNAIGDEGQSYIDDFEGSQSAIDIRSYSTWVLASVPQGQPSLFPEASKNNNLDYGKNRAKFNWNVYDPSVYYEKRGLVPGYIDGDAVQWNHLQRLVQESELFPNKAVNQTQGQIDRIAMFNLAYFPSERGPYNYDEDPSTDFSGLDNNGNLNNPTSRWGGIMRQLQTNDFENSNIEYIQFWVMDPFHSSAGGTNDDSPNSTGGDLYFNLGNVSEDILRDGAKSFENGLTTDGTYDASKMKTTVWGRVPTTQSIVNAFDNNPTTRKFQDVGLDGLTSAEEKIHFSNYLSWVNSSSLSTSAKNKIISDPSGDDYVFHRDDNHDSGNKNIVDRYKDFNGLEGNSPTNEQSKTINTDGYPTSKTTTPDLEDINRDNNLSETESYYQYKVSMRPSDMVVGKNYIIDKVSRQHAESKKSVDWYQFRIPINQPSKVVNGIQDFRSIRFMRLFMKGFSEPVVMRFARLELLRGTWRRYDKDIVEDGEYIQGDPASTVFNIGAVNIEENGQRQPINYILPPNFQREINPNSAEQSLLNEQSIEFEVCGLKDGVAKASFRNIEFDLLSYKKIKMFVHGEQHAVSQNTVKDDDLTIFIRLGSDFQYNYYEYEMPIKMTSWSVTDPYQVWPEANNLEIILEDLKRLKIARNNSDQSLIALYQQQVPGKSEHLIKIIGNPNLQGLKTIMIGIRNPNKDKSNPWKPDDGLDKCAKIWVNELRMTDFDNQGGWAAQSRVQANLADFANISLAGHISTPGFGGIEQRVSERLRETVKQLDASASVQLGKFFPKDFGIQIPMYVGISEGIIDPQFDPLNPDLKMEESIADQNPDEQLAKIKAARDLTSRRSINFTNVRIAPVTKSTKSYPWDMKNFSVSYSFSELYKRDIQTEYNTNKIYNGTLNYVYQHNMKPYSPFRNSKFLRKSKWFALIRDINITPLPKQFSFNTKIDRTYNETKARDITGNALIIPQFNKTFTWDRMYSTSWNLTKAIRINYNANNQGLIEEPGDLQVNEKFFPDDYERVKDSVWKSIRRFGENNHYMQSANVSYKWPFQKIPLVDFINLSTKYQGTYDWQRAPLSQDTLGNTIQNSRNVSWSGNLNMTKLYNKIPYFRKVNQKSRMSQNRRRATVSKPKKGKKGKKTKKKKDPNKMNVLDYTAKLLMSLQSVNFRYSTIDGQLLPGYSQNSEILGMSNGFTSPGLEFVFGGEQERDIFGRETNYDFAGKARDNNWLINGVTSRYLNAQHTTNHSKNFSTSAVIEPFKGIRLELSANYIYSENMTENFMDTSGIYEHLNTMRNGNYSYSFNSIRTAFEKDEESGFSQTFQDLLNNRKSASNFLSEENPYSNGGLDSQGFYDGYGSSQQEVILSSFISAYSGKELTKKTLNPLSAIPNLNWRLNIDILNRIPFVKKYFRNIIINHAYNSTFTVASFNTNLDAKIDANGNSSLRDEANNIRPDKQIITAAITEQFNPLFKINATWKNSLITNFEYKSNRNISLSLTNNQITELKGSEITVGLGYRFSQVKFPWKIGKKKPVSDINARIDFSLRNNKTIIRKIDQNQTQVTAGQQYISIKAGADYTLTKQFTIRFYYDRVMTNPFISTSFPTMNQNVGFAMQVKLFQ